MELIIFEYGKDEINYLKDRDKELGEIIDKVGMIEREVDEDVFGALVKNIVGQQISSLAQRTVCARLLELLGKITPETIQNADVNDIQKCGMSLRKAEYIKAVGEKAREIDFGALVEMSDEELIKTLTSIRGVGVWTAEMILIFSLGRKNVLSFGDLAIKRGMCKLYGYGSIDKKTFEEYREKYSPYGSIASLYLWEIS